MVKQKQNQKRINIEGLPIINTEAVGIDVGSKSHFVAIGQRMEDVKEFGVYTEDLHELAQYVIAHGKKSVAMESTGTYWQMLFLILQDYGLEVILVNGRFTKNVRGRKSDVMDCQWIQKLHACGMLQGSFLPDNFTESLREYSRHRKALIESGASYISKMEKVLRLMNFRVDNVLRDSIGKSGQAIIQAILNGEREGKELAKLADCRVKASKEELAKALTGDFREEYIFELKQSYELYQFFHQKISECDIEIEKMLQKQIEYKQQQDGGLSEFKKGKPKKVNKNDPKINLEKLSYELSGGVDLSEIVGVGRSTILSIISEVGFDLSKFPTGGHFASWLSLAPNNKISGGKVLSRHTPKWKNRLAIALEHAANVIGNGSSVLSHFFKRICYKKGRMVAIVATAHKLAVIIWNMLTKKEPFNYIDETQYLNQIRKNQVKSIQRKILQLGIKPEEINFATN